MSADATVQSLNQIDKRTNSENAATFNWRSNPNMIRQPDYHLYMFNVGPMKHEVARPPIMVKATIPACPKGQKYIMAFKIGNIVNQIWADPDNGEPRTHAEYGERVMMDIVNPYNLGIDQDAPIDENHVFSVNADLGKFGVFWSKNEVPTDEEIQKAVGRMEKHFRQQLNVADALARAGKQSEITDVQHMAADHFHYKAGWHVQVEAPVSCPNCGEDIKPGVAFHKNSMDLICVIDWQRTVAAGAKKKSEVPEDKRWWKEA